MLRSHSTTGRNGDVEAVEENPYVVVEDQETSWRLRKWTIKTSIETNQNGEYQVENRYECDWLDLKK